jgi:hypothetical protein
VRGTERGEPGRWCEYFSGFAGCAHRGEEAPEKCLHGLDYEVEVALKFEPVRGEDCLQEAAEMKVNVSGLV